MRGIKMQGYGLGNRSSVSGIVQGEGSFVPLSWTGAKVGEYTFAVANTTPYTYNIISRTVGVQSFDMAIFSNEVVNSDDPFVFSGDIIQNGAGTNFFVGFGLKSDTGIGFADLDFAFWANGTNINWFESGSNGGVVATITSSEVFSYRLEYVGTSNSVKLYINNVLAHTATTAYSSDDLAMKLLGRNSATKICKHLALKSITQPNKSLVALGDSITDGTVAGILGGSYIERSLAYTNNRFYANPVYAVFGATSTVVIADQLPNAVADIDVTKTSNVATVMIGINDIRASVAIATIDANIQTIVTDLQTAGYFVVLQTILRDFGTAWADRLTLNSNIISNTYGADAIVDYTTTILETDNSLFPDDLHPNTTGNKEIANVLWLVLRTL